MYVLPQMQTELMFKYMIRIIALLRNGMFIELHRDIT